MRMAPDTIRNLLAGISYDAPGVRPDQHREGLRKMLVDVSGMALSGTRRS